MTDNEQFSQLEKKNKQDQQTVERLQKKEKNQKTEITRLDVQVKQLKAEVKKHQESNKKEQEKYASEKQDIEQKMSNLQSTLTLAIASATTAKEETAVFQRKLKEAEEDREHLKNQVANAAEKRPKSVVAKELLVGFTKLLDAQFGAPDAGGESLLKGALHEGTGDLLFLIKSMFEQKSPHNSGYSTKADSRDERMPTLLRSFRPRSTSARQNQMLACLLL